MFVFLTEGAGWRRSPETLNILVVCLSEWALAAVGPSGSPDGGRLTHKALRPGLVRLHFTPVTSWGLRLFPKNDVLRALEILPACYPCLPKEDNLLSFNKLDFIAFAYAKGCGELVFSVCPHFILGPVFLCFVATLQAGLRV